MAPGVEAQGAPPVDTQRAPGEKIEEAPTAEAKGPLLEGMDGL